MRNIGAYLGLWRMVNTGRVLLQLGLTNELPHLIHSSDVVSL